MQKEAPHFDTHDVILLGDSAGEGMIMHEQRLANDTLKESVYDLIAAINNAEAEGYPHAQIVIADVTQKR